MYVDNCGLQSLLPYISSEYVVIHWNVQNKQEYIEKNRVEMAKKRKENRTPKKEKNHDDEISTTTWVINSKREKKKSQQEETYTRD